MEMREAVGNTRAQRVANLLRQVKDSRRKCRAYQSGALPDIVGMAQFEDGLQFGIRLALATLLAKNANGERGE